MNNLRISLKCVGIYDEYEDDTTAWETAGRGVIILLNWLRVLQKALLLIQNLLFLDTLFQLVCRTKQDQKQRIKPRKLLEYKTGLLVETPAAQFFHSQIIHSFKKIHNFAWILNRSPPEPPPGIPAIGGLIQPPDPGLGELRWSHSTSHDDSAACSDHQLSLSSRFLVTWN